MSWQSGPVNWDRAFRAVVHPVILSVIILEVARVDVRQEGWLLCLGEHLLPVYITEPGVLHNLSNTLTPGAGIPFEHSSQEILYFFADEGLV